MINIESNMTWNEDGIIYQVLGLHEDVCTVEIKRNDTYARTKPFTESWVIKEDLSEDSQYITDFYGTVLYASSSDKEINKSPVIESYNSASSMSKFDRIQVFDTDHESQTDMIIEYSGNTYKDDITTSYGTIKIRLLPKQWMNPLLVVKDNPRLIAFLSLPIITKGNHEKANQDILNNIYNSLVTYNGQDIIKAFSALTQNHFIFIRKNAILIYKYLQYVPGVLFDQPLNPEDWATIKPLGTDSLHKESLLKESASAVQVVPNLVWYGQQDDYYKVIDVDRDNGTCEVQYLDIEGNLSQAETWNIGYDSIMNSEYIISEDDLIKLYANRGNIL